MPSIIARRRRGAGDHGDAPGASMPARQLRGRVDQHVVHDRRAAVVRDPVLADRVEDRARPRPCAGTRWCRRRRPSSRGSTSRCSGTSAASTDRPRACGMPQSKHVAERVQVGAAVVVDDALRIAGGAGGVVQRDRVPLVGRRLPGELRVALGEERLVVDVAETLAARRTASSSTSMTSGRRATSCASARSIVGENSRSVISTRASAVVEHERDRVGVEPRVERVQHRAGHRHAEVRLEHLRRVGEHHGDRVAHADAAPDERRGQPAAARVGLRPGVAARAVDDGESAPDRPRPPAR